MTDDQIKLMVRDSRGTFTFEEWQKLPPEIPSPLNLRWWADPAESTTYQRLNFGPELT